jgi:hypothetical protein
MIATILEESKDEVTLIAEGINLKVKKEGNDLIFPYKEKDVRITTDMITNRDKTSIELSEDRIKDKIGDRPQVFFIKQRPYP